MYNTNQFSKNYGNQFKPIQTPNYTNNNDRFVGGGFLGPFILGGITGGLVSPLFYGGGYNRPYYNNNYYYPYPIYGPYYYR